MPCAERRPLNAKGQSLAHPLTKKPTLKCTNSLIHGPQVSVSAARWVPKMRLMVEVLQRLQSMLPAPTGRSMQMDRQGSKVGYDVACARNTTLATQRPAQTHCVAPEPSESATGV